MIKGPVNGSPDWVEYRCGLVTASRFGDILTPPKTKEAKAAGLMSTTAESYLMEVVTSGFTKKPAVGGKSAAMIRGNDLEMDAGDAYSKHRASDFVQVNQGHIWVKEGTIIAASLDFEVEDDDEGPGIVECKCPDQKTHLAYWLRYWEEEEEGTLTVPPGGGTARILHVPPEDYVEQIQGQLWVTERVWCDFVSYDNRFPPPMQLLTYRVYRDDAMIETLAREIPRFAEAVQSRLTRVKALARTLGPLEEERLIHNLLETSGEE